MVKEYRPTTPSRRGMSVADWKKILTPKKPEKGLVFGRAKKSGRARGKITVRHIGGGHKQKYRLIDFKFDKINIPAKVSSIEYDPNRSAFIVLIIYADGEKRYILAPEGLKVGQEIVVAPNAPLKLGNRLSLANIPTGTNIYNLELIPGKGAQLIRSAGSFATVGAKENGFVHINFPSGEIRMVPENAMASIGQVSNPEHRTIVLGKAGRSRWLGIRPTVRGSAMNPVDHPHGGGEGRQPIGLPYPKTPWGKHALGVKTRKKKKPSEKYIIKHRK